MLPGWVNLGSLASPLKNLGGAVRPLSSPTQVTDEFGFEVTAVPASRTTASDVLREARFVEFEDLQDGWVRINTEFDLGLCSAAY